MNFGLWEIAILLLAAKIGGAIFQRLGQPSLAGELIAGIVMGALVTSLADSATIQLVAELGIILLILLTMMVIDLSSIEKDIEKLVIAQAVSAVIIYALLVTLSSVFTLSIPQTLVVWAAIFGSSTVISARALMAMNSITSREGQAVMGLQIINGIIELLLISSVINVIQYQEVSWEPVLKLALMVVGTVVVMSRYGSHFIRWLFNSVRVFRLEEALLALTLVLAFLAGAVTEAVGMTSYLGVMLIGVLISRTEQSKVIAKKISDLGEAFFIPVFFASLGLTVSLVAVAQNFQLLLFLLVALTAIRFLAYLVPVKLLGYTFVESMKITSLLLPMSEYGLLMLSIGVDYGVLTSAMYSVLIVVFLLVNILAPMLAIRLFRIPSVRSDRRGGAWI
ncbi:MAG: cation:proton antiporter [Methanomicrobiales archaeon]|nr:cation:proton antiporter [Methanomicrobiales archaeon]